MNFQNAYATNNPILRIWPYSDLTSHLPNQTIYCPEKCVFAPFCLLPRSSLCCRCFDWVIDWVRWDGWDGRVRWFTGWDGLQNIDLRSFYAGGGGVNIAAASLVSECAKFKIIECRRTTIKVQWRITKYFYSEIAMIRKSRRMKHILFGNAVTC